ncbi:MAG TPA: purine-nucleoside phosphorylase, partial [Candidatus Avimonas sp.]|nr:purine-nucleoside phosphorylase [Candidatus Avimonas sp.]
MIPFEEYKRSADFLRKNLPECPEVAVVLGSGLGRLAEEVESKITIPYKDIPGFPMPTVESHAGLLIYGRLNGR